MRLKEAARIGQVAELVPAEARGQPHDLLVAAGLLGSWPTDQHTRVLEKASDCFGIVQEQGVLEERL